LVSNKFEPISLEGWCVQLRIIYKISPTKDK
jgi:hypothetical protein